MLAKLNKKKSSESSELKTVPTDHEITSLQEANEVLEELVKPIVPITYLDYNDPDHGSIVGNIMSLPTEIQSNNNLDVVRNMSLYTALNDIQLACFHANQTTIQVEQVIELINSMVIQNFTGFIASSNFLPLYNVNKNLKTLEEIRQQQWITMSRSLREILDSDYYVDMMKRVFFTIHDTFTDHSAIMNTTKDYNVDMVHINQIVASMNSISKQILEIISIPVCKVVNEFVEEGIPYQDEKTIKAINSTFELKKDLETLNDLRSFMNEGLMNELRYLLMVLVKSNIDHICDNYYLTLYSVYRDIFEWRLEEREENEIEKK